MDKRITIAILVLLVLSNVVGVVTLMGVLPAPKPVATVQSQPKVQPTASTATNYNDINVTGEIDAPTANVTTANITTGNVTTANITTLNIGGISQSGAIKYGAATLIATASTITHGFATTPTVCLVSPGGYLTVTIGTVAATTMTVTSSVASGIAYWMCGK